MNMGRDIFYIILSILIIIGIVVVFVLGEKGEEAGDGILANLPKLSKNSLGQDKKIDTQNMSEFNREPAVAGQFYPEDTEELKLEVKKYLDKSSSIEKKGKPRILVVPHAGYVYSGQIAADGFAQLEGHEYKKVILIGGSHTAYHSYAAVYRKGSWDTPLGKVKIDEDLALALMDGDLIKNDFGPHKKEHSLEIELPFLQTVLSDFKIVPILVSETSEELKEELAWRIAQNFDDETLLVVSTDLSHYPTGEIAEKVDSQVIEGILSGKSSEFEKIVSDLNSKAYKNEDTVACGQKAVSIALKVAEYLRLKDFAKISYTHSGQVTGDNSRVVGYGSVGAWSEEKPSVFDQEFEKEALKISRETLERFLTSQEILKRVQDDTVKDEIFKKKLGVFVTLRNKGELRGCLGEFEPKENLLEVIKDRTIAAASKDPRFNAVTEEELSDIEIEISVLTPMRKISDWRNIKLGEHGVTIVRGNKGGTFLPQVAGEAGWSLEEFLGQLCSQKAGLNKECYKDPETEIYVYEAKVFGEMN